MFNLFLTTVISCNQFNSVIQRIESYPGFTVFQKIELIKELKRFIPSCPIQVKKNDRR